LLIEESRTNIPARSEDLSVSPWSYSNVTISKNTDVSPDGQTTADKVVENTANSSHTTGTLATGLTIGQQYTFSIYLKASGRNFAFVGDFAGVGSEFNLSTGSIVSGGTGSPQIQNMGNGWYRCSVTGTQAATVAAPGFRIRQTSGVSSYTGDGVSGILAWGAQFELGLFATSYIPTTTASVVRSADVCSITGSNFTNFYNFTEGTIFVVFSGLMSTVTGGNRGIAAISDSSYSNNIQLSKVSGAASIEGVMTRTSASQFNFTQAGYVQGGTQKISCAFTANNAAFSFNGGISTDNTVVLPTTLTNLTFRDPTGASGGHPTGHLQSFKYFRKRLSNAKLQAFTA
jgi:hypothetical protein